MTNVFWFVALAIVCMPLVIFLFVKVHHAMDRICVGHARRYCEKNGLEVSRFRWQPAFDKGGVKTELTLVQLECINAQKQRRLVEVAVWPLGFHKLICNEAYPDKYDEKWPRHLETQ